MNQTSRTCKKSPETKNSAFHRLIWIAASLLIMGLIFFFSSQNGRQSSAVSGRFLFLLTWLMSEQQASHLIRKGAHFTIYFLLGFCLYGVFAPDKHPDSGCSRDRSALKDKENVRSVLLAGLCAGLYAASDELHQLFISARSGQISDVLLDCAGALCGIALHLAAVRLCSRCATEKN